MGQFAAALSFICQKTKAELEVVGQRLIYDIFVRLVQRSPVRTGRFRANWNYGYDAPDLGTSESTVAPSTPLETRPLAGHVVWITNSLPYALRLEYGWSKQAPAGMVRITVEEADMMLGRAVAAAREIV